MFSKNPSPALATAYAGVPTSKRRTTKQRASEVAPPVVPLNTKLHAQILAQGTAKASTLESAMAALQRIRSGRGG